MQPDDDELWKGIVDNYGDRPELAPDEAPVAPPEPDATAAPAPREPASWDDVSPDSDWTTDRFVPPEPPPVPTTTQDRVIAWTGLFGAPAALLVCLIIGIDIPQWVAFLLVASFVAGFLYLVIKMPREPRDPGDDGAVL